MNAAPPGMPYHYFVSYSHSQGFGNGDIYRETPIRNAQDAKQAADAIERNGPCRGVIVLYFNLLED